MIALVKLSRIRNLEESNDSLERENISFKRDIEQRDRLTIELRNFLGDSMRYTEDLRRALDNAIRRC